jgi:hypothetical protein
MEFNGTERGSAGSRLPKRLDAPQGRGLARSTSSSWPGSGPSAAQGHPAAHGGEAGHAPEAAPQPARHAPAGAAPPEADKQPEPPSNTDELANTGDTGPVGHPDGDPKAIGLPFVPGLPPGGGGEGTGTDVLPFGTGMTPPVLTGGQPIEDTPQAQLAGVQGTMLVKCVARCATAASSRACRTWMRR